MTATEREALIQEAVDILDGRGETQATTKHLRALVSALVEARTQARAILSAANAINAAINPVLVNQ